MLIHSFTNIKREGNPTSVSRSAEFNMLQYTTLNVIGTQIVLSKLQGLWTRSGSRWMFLNCLPLWVIVQLNLFPRLWLSRAVRKISLRTANMVQFMQVSVGVLVSGQVGT